MPKRTTIKIDPEVAKELFALKEMGESYTDVIKKLLKNQKK